MLLYKLTEEEVLEIIAMFVDKQLPPEVNGLLDFEYNEEGELEVRLFQRSKEMMLN